MFDTFTGVANTYTYDFSIENYGTNDDLSIRLAGTNDTIDKTQYDIVNNQVIFVPEYEIQVGQTYEIFRETSTTPRSVFYPSGAIRADDLNNNFNQALRAADDRVPKFNAVFQDDINMNEHVISGLKDTYTELTSGEGANVDTTQAVSVGWLSKFYYDTSKDTIKSNATWVGDDLKVATTEAIEQKIDSDIDDAITTDIVSTDVDGILINRNLPNTGQITIGVKDNSLGLDKIKDSIIQAKEETSYADENDGDEWLTDDSKLATLAAIAHRHDNFVQGFTPDDTYGHKTGTFHFNANNDNNLSIWDGNSWETVVAGVKDFIKQETLIWVDAKNGSDSRDGHRVVDPMRTIQGAVNRAKDGDIIYVQPGVYREALPIDLGRKKNVSIIGMSMRSVFVHPDPNHYWEVQNTSVTSQENFGSMERNLEGNLIRAQDYVGSQNNLTMIAGPHGQRRVKEFNGPEDHPQGSELETMFKLGTGSFIANLSLCGMKAAGARGDSIYSADSQAPQQGWFVGFSENDGAGNQVKYYKSPYIQNCTAFADSAINNATKAEFDNDNTIGDFFDPNDITQPGFGGDKTSAPTGGALLCDGSIPHIDSPLRSILTDAFTLICLDGPGALVNNGGYAQLVSTFGHFCHYHAKAESGGMINMSNCTTDFGRYGLIADGRSSQIFTSNLTEAVTVDSTTIKVNQSVTPWSARNNNNPKPVNHMVLQIAGHDTVYPITKVEDVSVAGGTDYYLITLSKAITQAAVDATGESSQVKFFLRSLITTGGHVMEFVGSGTDYSAHPDNGGSPVEDNQVHSLNDGKVYISSTDSNGKFSVGDIFFVDTDTKTTAIKGTFELQEGASINGTLLVKDNLTVEDNTTLSGSTTFGPAAATQGQISVVSNTVVQNNILIDAQDIDRGTLPDARLRDALTDTGDFTNPRSITTDAKGRITAITAGLKPVTSVETESSLTLTENQNTEDQTLGIKVFGSTYEDNNTNLKGVVSSTSDDATKFLQGDGVWASPTANLDLHTEQIVQGTSASIDLDIGTNNDERLTLTSGAGVQINSDGDSTIIISAPNTNKAAVYINDTPPLSSVDTDGEVVQINPGDMWWDKTTGESYIYYEDSDQSQWVQFAPQQRGTANGTVTGIRVTASEGLSASPSYVVGTAPNFSGIYNITLDNVHNGIPAVPSSNEGYGGISSVPQLTINSKGQVTKITEHTIEIDPSNVKYENAGEETVSVWDSSGNTFQAATIPNLNVSQIPDLTADKITYTITDDNGDSQVTTIFETATQKLKTDVIPQLEKSKIKVDDQWAVSDIPDLTPSKIPYAADNHATFDALQIPDLSSSVTYTDGSSDVTVHGYLQNVSDDGSPSLGGDFSVGAYKIKSNSNIQLEPASDKSVNILGSSDHPGSIKLFTETVDNTTKSVTLKGPAYSNTTSYTLTFPGTKPDSNKILQSDASGNLSWVVDQNTEYSNFTGITRDENDQDQNGIAGLVPAPIVDEENDVRSYVLKGDGNWGPMAAFFSGMIMYWPGPVDTIPSGWRMCNGDILLKADYSSLHLVISDKYDWQFGEYGPSSAGYGTPNSEAQLPQNTNGNSTRYLNVNEFNTTTHFQIPDLRGEFIRSFAGPQITHGEGDDAVTETYPDQNRGIGQHQADQIQEHKHAGGVQGFGNPPVASSNMFTGNYSGAGIKNFSVGIVSDESLTNVARKGDETRPRNISMIAIIKE